LPVSRTQSVAEVSDGGFRRVGSESTMGMTVVQVGNGGVRVESIQRWNGSRSMNIGTDESSSVVISARGVGAEEHLGHYRFDAEDDELLALPTLLETVVKELMLVCGEA
jgi:hypothetical protein